MKVHKNQIVSASYDKSIKVSDLSNRNNDSNTLKKDWHKDELVEVARINEKNEKDQQHEAGISLLKVHKLQIISYGFDRKIIQWKFDNKDEFLSMEFNIILDQEIGLVKSIDV